MSATGPARAGMVDADFWRDRRVLVTGHTGFKGAWMALWLQSLGASVTGFALESPTQPSLYELARVGDNMHSVLGDVRDHEAIAAAVAQASPEIVIHMAAQSLVRRSFAAPRDTYATNVMGTVNVLDAVRVHGAHVRALVNVTSDKCYENREWEWGYREDEPMGGHDPYSSSKGCAELVTDAFRRSFFSDGTQSADESQTIDGSRAADGSRTTDASRGADGSRAAEASRGAEASRAAEALQSVDGSQRARRVTGVASARAGNVIGGGDWGEDRLLPDIMRAALAGEQVRVRNPNSIRPWQHVLNPLSGYLVLAQALCESREHACGWNFGPPEQDARPVGWIVQRTSELWPAELRWVLDDGPHPHEARYLKLDSSRARARLGWRPLLGLDAALEATVEWYTQLRAGADMRAVTVGQIETFQYAGACT